MGAPQSSRVPGGHAIADKYRLVRKLGQGGMGTVWLAEHLVLESQVAVKLIDNDSEDMAQLVRRFLREAKAAAALNSPHVVRIFDYGVDDDMPYMVMELLEGESLRSRLDREGVLTPEMTATVMTHVARGLAKAHEAGIIHRDLKPDNVYLVGSDDELIVKILDFGIAKDTKNLEVGADTHTGAVIGSPYYLSPEQARGHKDVDRRADLWALGVMAFECLVGQRPFRADTLGELLLQICIEPIAAPSTLGAVPEGFDAWFAKATMRDREQRFRSAKEMVAMLRRAAIPGSTDPSGVTAADDVPTAREPVVRSAGSAGTPTLSLGLSNTTAAVSTSNRAGLLRGGRAPVSRRMAAAFVIALLVVGVVVVIQPGTGNPSPEETRAAATGPDEPARASASAAPVERVEPVLAAPPPAPYSGRADAGRMPAGVQPKPGVGRASRRRGANPGAAASGPPRFDPLGQRF